VFRDDDQALLPRVLPDGTRNGIRLLRLEDKLGNRSNASAEIELDAERLRSERTRIDGARRPRVRAVCASPFRELHLGSDVAVSMRV
jgi:hypothetical protein